MSDVMTFESIGVASWVGDLTDWATALADRVAELAKKYGSVSTGVLTALDAFRLDPTIANAYALWDAFVKFRDVAETVKFKAMATPEVTFSFSDWEAAIGLLIQLIEAVRRRRQPA